MKLCYSILILGIVSLIASCITWVRDTTDPKVTHGLIGAVIETKQTSMICRDTQPRSPKLFTHYFISPFVGKPLPEHSQKLETCPSGTRGRIVRFFKERDAGQFIWDYVEFEMDDPRLRQKYRIVRMLGHHNVSRYDPWASDGDFRIVSKPSDVLDYQ